MTSGLRVDSHLEAGALVVRPVGELTAATYADLRDGLLRYAAQQPRAIVVDLDSIGVTATAPLAVLPAVWMRICDWPGVPMVLAAARQSLRTLLDTSAVPWFVPTYRSVAEAVAALDVVPPCRRRKVQLPCDPDCTRRVRRVVEQTCHEWGIAQIVTDAVLVACELAENLIRHARSDGWLRLELRGAAFTVAVADADARPPRLRAPHERQGGGRGLVLIAELSRVWGYAPRVQGGKVVWAVLTVPAR
ncbi:MAG: ATP-binding protein [Pseudonocardiaceae bacterium]